MGVGNGVKTVASNIARSASSLQIVRSVVKLAKWGNIQKDLGRSHTAVEHDKDEWKGGVVRSRVESKTLRSDKRDLFNVPRYAPFAFKSKGSIQKLGPRWIRSGGAMAMLTPRNHT
jgi:hypothetical protein